MRPAPLLLLLLSGCMSVKYTATRSEAYGARSGQVHHAWQHSLLLGLIPVSSVDLDRHCPDTGILHVKSSIGPLGALATVLTAGVWTPSHVRVTCAAWPSVAGPTSNRPVVITTGDGTHVIVQPPR